VQPEQEQSLPKKLNVRIGSVCRGM
jgi:hypothetical protein